MVLPVAVGVARAAAKGAQVGVRVTAKGAKAAARSGIRNAQKIPAGRNRVPHTQKATRPEGAPTTDRIFRTQYYDRSPLADSIAKRKLRQREEKGDDKKKKDLAARIYRHNPIRQNQMRRAQQIVRGDIKKVLMPRGIMLWWGIAGVAIPVGSISFILQLGGVGVAVIGDTLIGSIPLVSKYGTSAGFAIFGAGYIIALLFSGVTLAGSYWVRSTKNRNNTAALIGCGVWGVIPWFNAIPSSLYYLWVTRK